MKDTSPITTIDQSFLNTLDPDGSLNLAACLQCGRCSSGCTMRQETDILPHNMVRMVSLGMKDQLLDSRAIWTCVSCHTCVARCPMQVDTPTMIDRLRQMAADAPEELKRVRIFNEIVLGSIEKFGRMHEFGVMASYKLKTRDFLSDLGKLPAMLRKGKLKLTPTSVKEHRSVAAMFDRVRRSRRSQQ